MTKAPFSYEHLVQLVDLQTRLLAAFNQQNPNVSDWETLLDFPRSGSVSPLERVWDFKRHGVGLRFVERHKGTVVDMHQYLRDPKVFDAWRLEQYLESIDANFSGYVPTAFLEQMLQDGKIERISLEGPVFRLASSSQ